MNDSEPVQAPLVLRSGNMALPALHLWWRFTWRFSLFPLALALAVLTLGALTGHLLARPGSVMAGTLMGAGLLWLLLIPLLILYSVWLMRAVIFRKPFLLRGAPHAFIIVSSTEPLSLPLPLEAALALWWGVAWRTWVVAFVAMVFLVFLGPLHIILQFLISYLAFLWLLSAPYGQTRILVRPLVAPNP